MKNCKETFPLQFSCCSKYIGSGGGSTPCESPCLARGFIEVGLDRDFILPVSGPLRKLAAVLVEGGDFFHIVRGQREIEDGEVLSAMFRI